MIPVDSRLDTFIPIRQNRNMASQISPPAFVEKWKKVQLPERAASHEHFIDLCNMLGQPTPASHDATGAEYAFEKSVAVSAAASAGSKGKHGFADVWWRGKFAWEYKTKDKYKDLKGAYQQLCQYREALDNPPLLIVCDIARLEIHTNFTGTAKQVHAIELAEMAEPAALDLLRRVFTDPLSFKPTLTAERVTQKIAHDFGELAKRLRARGHDPHEAAHFLMKCMFCLFAEDVNLLPNNLFQRLLESRKNDLDKLTTAMTELFDKMRTGGSFGVESIAYFNGGLFDESPALPLKPADVHTLLAAADQDWGSVEPAIFGTLFERSLDPNTRAQIGAHYTSRDDIMLIVEPVILTPLRREWESVRADVESQLERRRKAKTKKTQAAADKKIAAALEGFVDRLAGVSILDPACGSGNFLYVAIQQLLDLEKEVITFAARPDISLGLFPHVRPTQLHGIEINPYAAELAQVVIWIGYLQWMRDNGFNAPRDPILEPLQTIENRDAILDLSNPEEPRQAEWPEADFIIGNPPFLGTKLLRRGLGDQYVGALFSVYDGWIPPFSDLCCYWFELSHQLLKKWPNLRVGLLATQGIRGPESRTVLKRIKKAGQIYGAWSDREWVLDGATVHVSIVVFGKVDKELVKLNGKEVATINSDLTAGIDLSQSKSLLENRATAFIGDVKGGPFDIEHRQARQFLSAPAIGSQNATEVLRPWINARDLMGRERGFWIIDFGEDMGIREASRYSPFEYVKENVKPAREAGKPTRNEWWIHMRPCLAMREAINRCNRYIATPRVSKHRVFRLRDVAELPDCAVVVFASESNYLLGVLSSSLHELWARGTGTQLREAESGFRYSPTATFEGFPLPWSPGEEPTDDPLHQEIGAAAADLNRDRERWLNPPEWIEPIARAVDAEDDFADVPEDARPLIRESAIMARAAKDAKLKKRTLTNLYNERPTWLQLAHERLDRAVLAAYAAVDPEGDWDVDWAEVWKETGAGQPLPEDHALAERRAEVDQAVLANLLRMNLARAAEQ